MVVARWTGDFGVISIARRVRQSLSSVVTFSRRRLSRGASMVVLQQAAEALPAPDLAIYSANFVAGFEKTVVEALVVSAPMVVVEIRGDGLTQHCLAEEDHPAQRFGLEGAEKSLEVRIQIWRSWRKPHALHTFIFEHRTERIAELTVAVHDQVTLAVQESVLEIRQFASRLFHPGGVRIGRATGEVDTARGNMHDEQHVVRDQAVRVLIRVEGRK